MKKKFMINYYDVCKYIPHEWVFLNLVVPQLKSGVLYNKYEFCDMFKKFNKHITLGKIRQLIMYNSKLAKYRLSFNDFVLFGLPKTLRQVRKLNVADIRKLVKK